MRLFNSQRCGETAGKTSQLENTVAARPLTTAKSFNWLLIVIKTGEPESPSSTHTVD